MAAYRVLDKIPIENNTKCSSKGFLVVFKPLKVLLITILE